MRRRESTIPQRRCSEGGYSMVILIMAVMAITAMTAVALPTWTSIGQREREEELIHRGLQYAEAIRVFQRRFGRYPVRLKELIEVKPRCIRQLYPDPMNEEGEWGLIFATGGNRRGPNGRQQHQRGEAQGQDLAGGDLGTLAKSDLPKSSNLFNKKQQAVGPISGVYSRASSETTFKVFMDQEQYEQWAFTVDLVSGVANSPDRPPQVPSAKSLGRPFREGVTPLISFTQPNSPNGRGPRGGQGPPGVRNNQNPGNGNRVPSRSGGGVGGQGGGAFGFPGGSSGQNPSIPPNRGEQN